MTVWPWVALGGALGALARYYTSQWVAARTDFYWGTFTVNVVGCFLFGLIWALSQEEGVSPLVRVVLLSGFMGAFTTFSTFSFELVQLTSDRAWMSLFWALPVQLLSGYLSMVVGLWLGRSL